MPKPKKITVVSKCICNVCGQVANVVVNTEHHYCRGIKVLPGKTLPLMFATLTHPDPHKRGTWVLWATHKESYTQAEADAGVAAMEEMMASEVQCATPEPTVSN